MLSDVDKTLSRLTWTIFAMNSLTLINIGQSLAVPRPSLPKPQAHHYEQTTENSWSPYPRAGWGAEFHASCHYRQFITMAEILASNQAVFLSHTKGDVDALIPMFKELDERLNKWYMALPACMSKEGHPTPHVLALQ